MSYTCNKIYLTSVKRIILTSYTQKQHKMSKNSSVLDFFGNMVTYFGRGKILKTTILKFELKTNKVFSFT